MANETPITLVGRLTEDPTLRFTPSGTAVANLNIACNERKFNKQSGYYRSTYENIRNASILGVSDEMLETANLRQNTAKIEVELGNADDTYAKILAIINH